MFNHPLTFVDEIAPIFIVWSTLVGYSIALRKDEHVKMDILYTAIKSPKSGCLWTCSAISAGFCSAFS